MGGSIYKIPNEQASADNLGVPVEITNSIGMKYALIPAGEFVMGSLRFSGEHRHRVQITKPFYLGMYEVTQAEYEKVMGENPSHFSKGGDAADAVSRKDTSRHPVEEVSWNDAVEFCKRLSAKEGKRYRLPTEADWEYACRAGTTTPWCFGDDPASLGEYAWYVGNSDRKTHPVGQKKPNAWGLYDMHGNVSEWCQDRFDGDYYKDSPTDDPTGPNTGSERADRGGSGGDFAVFCRSACRSAGSPCFRSLSRGFRVALVAADASGK